MDGGEGHEPNQPETRNNGHPDINADLGILRHLRGLRADWMHYPADHAMGLQMKPKELADARKSFGMGRKQFGSLLGFGGDTRNVWITIKRYELGERQIPLPIQRLVQLLLWHKSDFGYLPDLDREGERVPLDTSGEFVE